MKLSSHLNVSNKPKGDETDWIAFGLSSSTSLNHLLGGLSSQQFVQIGESLFIFFLYCLFLTLMYGSVYV